MGVARACPGFSGYPCLPPSPPDEFSTAAVFEWYQLGAQWPLPRFVQATSDVVCAPAARGRQELVRGGRGLERGLFSAGDPFFWPVPDVVWPATDVRWRPTDITCAPLTNPRSIFWKSVVETAEKRCVAHTPPPPPPPKRTLCCGLLPCLMFK